ncbi:MAG: hypothetical protein EOO59_05690 [Hymenobacter sp.]|nr:MAG: hypothetical protein EOO59_05690 [Hymenobacter sp.]
MLFRSLPPVVAACRLAAGLLALPAGAWAQAPNDNIENRRLLQAEETVAANTTGCTVQWACVDERLTGKCIEYHNDQWFEFRPPADGTYYVNIGQQKCRDVRGVQLVALTGTPCQPATYRILACASLGTQDDLFVPLPGLRAGQPYLLNVDGYLKDYCGFTLQVSGRARGLPVLPPPAVPTTAPATSRVVELTWTVPDSLPGAQQCRVLRRAQAEFRSRERHRQPIERNTLGARRAQYALTDTLPGPGNYLYQVVADGDDPAAPPVVLRQVWVSYSKLRPIMPGAVADGLAFLDLPLARYPRGAYLTFILTNPENGNLLRHLALTNEPAQARRARLYAQPWLDAGLRQVAVDITCHPPHGAVTTDHLLLPLREPAY